MLPAQQFRSTEMSRDLAPKNNAERYRKANAVEADRPSDIEN